MRTNPWTLCGLTVCALMTANCAGSRPISTVAPPRLALPEAVTRPCALATLPEALVAQMLAPLPRAWEIDFDA